MMTMKICFTIQDKVHARLPVLTTTSAIGAKHLIFFYISYTFNIFDMSMICQWLLDHNAISPVHCETII